MAGIVGVHGIGQQFGGGYRLGNVWLSAIRDGLVTAGHSALAGALGPGDVRVAFFGDLFRPAGTMAAGGPPYSAADVRPGLERDLLAVWFGAAVAADRSLAVPERAMGRGRAGVQVMLHGLSRSKTFAWVAERAFVGNLRQVSAFLADPVVKGEGLGRVRGLVGADTRVVIGHSLGSVVAYEFLCQDRPGSVELLVTLGSPLGIAHVVFDRLTPAPAGGAGAWPGGVTAWVNVADLDDIVALRKDLAPLFPGRVTGQAVTDRLVDNGDEPHAADRYLNARQTGSALGDVLG